MNQNSRVQFEDRIRGAIWGSLAGDAFCLGSHWIYSLNEISARFPDGIKGFEAPSPGDYHYGKKTGDFTHYGDAALLMLSSVAKCGRFDASDFGSSLIRLMVDGDYQGYRDHAVQGTIANYLAYCKGNPQESFDYQQGADDDQPATVTRLAPVVVTHLNDPDLMGTVKKATLVCQNNSRAVAFTQAAALILRNLINGSTPESAVAETQQTLKLPGKAWPEVRKRMKIACAARLLPAIDATILFGQSCPLYSSFTAALQTTLSYPGDFAEAIRSTANAGGDNAGRAAMVGAWLGAHLGIKAIPEAWMMQLNARGQIESDVAKIVAGLEPPSDCQKQLYMQHLTDWS